MDLPVGPHLMDMSPPHALPPSSFEALYETYRRHVQRWVWLAGVPARDTEDLVQTVFALLHVAMAEGRFDGKHPRRFLWCITIRTARDYLARWDVRNVRLHAQEAGDKRDESIRSPEQRVLQHEADQRTRDVLESLPAARRSVLVMFEIEGLTVPEIAEALRINENTVGSRLRLARRDFKKAIARRLARDRGAFLFPVGPGLLPGRDIFAALSLRARGWITEARSVLGRALIKAKAVSASVGAGALLAVALGAEVVPQIHPSAHIDDTAPKIAAAAISASVTMATIDAPATPNISAPQPEPSTKSAAGPSSAGSNAGGALREWRSLERIQALVETEPAKALAALELHQKTFPQEHHDDERKGIQELARAVLAAHPEAHPATAPP